MNFCTPEYLVLRVYLDTELRPRFRANSLNLKAVHGLPLPILHGSEDYVMFLGKFLAKWTWYKDFLLLTQHIPYNAHQSEIPLEWPPECHLMLQGIAVARSMSGAEHVLARRDMRTDAMLQRYGALEKKDWTQSAILARIALEFDATPATTKRLLTQSGIKFAPPKKAAAPMDSASKLRRLDARYATLRRVCNRMRSNAKQIACSFKITDLYVRGELPTLCPVLGIPLNYDNPKALASVRVGRRDVSKPATAANVMLVSRIAQRMIEGTGDSLKLLAALDTDDLRKRWKQWTLEHTTHWEEPMVETLADLETELGA